MWFRFRRDARPTKSVRRTPPTFRPCLEALEDRCLMSAGSLDPTFGNGAGYVTTSLGVGNSAATVLIQPDGKILAAGGETASSGPGGDFAVTRYNPDGSLDTSFGSGGAAQAQWTGGIWGPYAALYPQEGTVNDGRIVQEGSSQGTGQLLLARFNANGTLDTTFGTGGEVTTAIPGQFVYSGGVVVTSTGQIVALADDHAGHIDLVRYNTDGSLDSTFGQGGEVISSIAGSGLGGQNGNVKSDTLLLQPDGKLIAVVVGSGGVVDLIRYNANGTLDASFGNQGIATASFGGTVQGAALYPTVGGTNDGKILIVGNQTATNTWALARFNADGSPDNSFGNAGEVVTQVSGNAAGIVLDANDRILVVGQNQAQTLNELARFNADGSPDNSFGSSGLAALPVTTFGPYGSNPRGLAVYPIAGTANDGDIVMVGGSARGNGNNSALVARFLPQATSTYFTITGPTSVTAGASGTYTISVYNPDGSADTGYSGTVHITSSDPKAVLPANFTISGGTATFSATLETAGLQTLTATDTTTSAITGSDAGITVTPAAASQVVFTQVPSSGVAGQTLGTVQVAIEDAYGNVETADNSDKVTLSVHSGPSTQLGGTLTATVQAGIATFSNLLLDTTGNYSLTANAVGSTLAPAVSSGIAVASPVSLTFGSITYNSKTKLYSETVTLTNTSSGTLTGPMSLVLTNLPSGVVLTDSSGTINGNPYVRFLTSGKTLKKGASTSITLTFTAASASDISFGTEVVVGL